MNDLAETLSAAFDGSDEAEQPEQTEQGIDAAEPVDDIDTAEEEMDAGAADQDDEPKEEEQEDPKASGIEPPQHWPAADRELFAKQTPEAQEFLMRRHKEMEADYTRKNMEVSNIRKTWEPVNELFSRFPHVNPTQTVMDWAQIAQSLQSDPVNTLQYLAQQHGVDLGNLPDAPQIDPQVAALHKELAQLKNQYTQREQMESQQAQSQKLTEIQRFAEEKDEKGNLVRPLVEEAMPEMVVMAQVAIQRGQQPNLQDLYDRAVYANPELRAKVLQQEKAQEEAKRKMEAVAKAKQAKRQSKSIDGGAGESSDADSGDLRSLLERQFG